MLKSQIKTEREDLDKVLDSYKKEDFEQVYEILKEADRRHKDK